MKFYNLGDKTFETDFNLIQYGRFLKHYGMGGGIMAPLVTSVFLKVEGQNLVPWGILMCLLRHYDVIIGKF